MTLADTPQLPRSQEAGTDGRCAPGIEAQGDRHAILQCPAPDSGAKAPAQHDEQGGRT